MGDKFEARALDSFQSDEKNHRCSAATRIELGSIFASGHFGKAPILERLLVYLVEQTLEGKGELLKSYVVGVDGLGKDPDFDPNVDSYPRVQVLRLRKMLEAYYARHEPVEELCLYIPAGSYGVRLARRAKAYPELIIASDGAQPSAGTAQVEEAPGAARAFSDIQHLAYTTQDGRTTLDGPARESVTGKQPARIWLVVALIGALVVAYFWWPNETPGPVAAQEKPVRFESPVMLIERSGVTPDVASQALAEEAYAKIADSINRSWVVQLRLEERSNKALESRSVDYRLMLQLGEPQGSQRPLYLRLTDNRTGELIWTSTALIDPAKSLSDSFGKSIAQLAGPFGIIASRETRQMEGAYSKGYSCLLGYVQLLKTQDLELRGPLSECLTVPIGISRLDAVRLGLLSFYVIETAPPPSRPAAIGRALSLAQSAISLDPKEAYAHFAMSRIYFVSDNCEMGMLHTGHAFDANPYDPVLLAVLGNFASLCGDPDGDELLERAYEFRSPGESVARLSLILAAIRKGRTDQLPFLSSEAENVPHVNPAYHFLCETLIAAASGNSQKAKMQWLQFASVSAAPKGTPDDMLQRVVLSQQVRQRIIAVLQSSKVLPLEPQSERLRRVTAVNEN